MSLAFESACKRLSGLGLKFIPGETEAGEVFAEAVGIVGDFLVLARGLKEEAASAEPTGGKDATLGNPANNAGFPLSYRSMNNKER